MHPESDATPTPQDDAPRGPHARLGPLDSYVAVLGMLVITFMFGTAAPDAAWSAFVDVVLQGLTLALLLRVSRASRHVQWTLGVLIVISVGTALVNWVEGSEVGDGATSLVTGVLVAAGPVLIILGTRRRSLRVDVQTIAAALCIYMMIGLFYAYIYGAVGAFHPPFFAQTDTVARADFLYFSFVTLTTTGYGDLSAVGNVGRALSVSEAILGQVYLVTVVAVVVSNIGRPALRRELRTAEALDRAELDRFDRDAAAPDDA